MRKLSILIVPALLVAAFAVTGPFAGASASVSVKDDFFSPKTKTVSKGTKVTWRWKGRNPHNVVSKSGTKLSSKVQTKGTYSKKITKTTKYVCTIHSGMKGTIKVN